MEDYKHSDEIEKIANRLISENHPHLKEATIAFLMKVAEKDKRGDITMKLPKRTGKNAKIASACLVPAKYFALCGFDFLIVVKEEFWSFFEDDQKEALLDHELSHCLKDDDGFYVGDHDLEEFRTIIERHGAWKSDVRRFCDTVQKCLPFEMQAVDKSDPETMAIH